MAHEKTAYASECHRKGGWDHCVHGFQQFFASLLRCFEINFFKPTRGLEDPERLVRETVFSASEIQALYELFKKISSAVVDDG
ncbi:Calcineurin B-like protein [Drosera capensis]